VVDAYYARVLSRHCLMPENADYDDIRRFFEEALPRDTQLYNEFHALIVWTGNAFCSRTPRCGGCPLEKQKKKQRVLRSPAAE